MAAAESHYLAVAWPGLDLVNCRLFVAPAGFGGADSGGFGPVPPVPAGRTIPLNFFLGSIATVVIEHQNHRPRRRHPLRRQAARDNVAVIAIEPSPMTDTKDAGLSPALVETVAGLSAGTMATLIVHPLDIVKTRMQSTFPSLPLLYHPPKLTHPPVHRTTTAAPNTPLTTVSVLRSLAHTDRPLAALYRGLTPNLLGNASSWASFFFFKSLAERGLSSLHHGGTAALTPADYFAASLAAGAATQILTNPIWVLKTRMLSSDRAAAGAYPSMWAGAARLLRAEGPRGFYRGLGVGMMSVSHGAVQFAVYDPARRWYFARRGGGGEGDSKQMGNEATIVLSTAAKAVAGVTTYPLQVLRSRLQHYEAETLYGRGVRGGVGRLWREEGWRGFYRGMVPGVVRVLPATWVTFLVYENVRYYLPRWL